KHLQTDSAQAASEQTCFFVKTSIRTEKWKFRGHGRRTQELDPLPFISYSSSACFCFCSSSAAFATNSFHLASVLIRYQKCLESLGTRQGRWRHRNAAKHHNSANSSQTAKCTAD